MNDMLNNIRQADDTLISARKLRDKTINVLVSEILDKAVKDHGLKILDFLSVEAQRRIYEKT